MAAVVHVAIETAGRRFDVTAPTDWPVERLMPELLRLVHGGAAPDLGPDAWVIGYPAGRPFAGASTLRDERVREGALLSLEPAPARLPASQRTWLKEAGADGLLPRQRTLAVLPARASRWERVSSTLGALAAGAEHEPAAGEPAPGVPVAPESLTLSHRPTAIERVRASWRGSHYLQRLESLIQQPRLRRCVTIAVMSPKGGVGKTTITALLGSLLALLRRDRIVAVDTNPDFGSLGRTLAPGHRVFVDDLLALLDGRELTVTALDAKLGRSANGLMVLPAPTDPARMARLDQTAYLRVVRRLQDLVGVVLLDCGTGLHEPATLAALRSADQVVLISDAEPATASLVAEAAALLNQEGVPIWLLVNKLPASGARLDVGAFESCVPGARGLAGVPANPRAAVRVSAGLLDWRDAPRAWGIAAREVAAMLVAAWSDLDVTTDSPRRAAGLS